MGRLDRPRLRGTALGTALRLWNPVMKRLLASRFHWPWSRWFLLISWTGRKTGRDYQTPVSYVRHDHDLLITTGDAWWRYLVGGAEVRVWFGGRRQRATAEPVLDEEESLALHARMFVDQPLFAVLAGLSRAADRDQITRSIRAGRTLIRVRLV
ncbi:MAG: nitroreductase family deazaflavin-dependent oxidoreductase [Chloroflexi bacterium]|nr:nitroreductase family deazaflavin-dependent oxidoreductase [Chloroflexota bacterium]